MDIKLTVEQTQAMVTEAWAEGYIPTTQDSPGVFVRKGEWDALRDAMQSQHTERKGDGLIPHASREIRALRAKVKELDAELANPQGPPRSAPYGHF